MAMTGMGPVFRQAWAGGVRAHYPGDPKPGYVAPWSDTPQWERESAAAAGDLVLGLLKASGGAAVHLSRTQKSQFVAASWAAQVWMRIPDPKPAYVAGWEDLPGWQQETDADIFEAIENHTGYHAREGTE